MGMLTFFPVSRSVPSARPFVNFSVLVLSQVKLMASKDKCMTSIMLRSNLPAIDLNTKTGVLFARKQREESGDVVVKFLFQVIFVFLLFFGMVM